MRVFASPRGFVASTLGAGAGVGRWLRVWGVGVRGYSVKSGTTAVVSCGWGFCGTVAGWVAGVGALGVGTQAVECGGDRERLLV